MEKDGRALIGRDVFEVLTACARRAYQQQYGSIAVDLILAELAGRRAVDPLLPSHAKELIWPLRRKTKGAPSQSSGEGSDSHEYEPLIDSLLREVNWRAARFRTRRQEFSTVRATLTWSDGVKHALALGLVAAESAGVAYASSSHFLVGLLEEPAGSAVNAMRNAGLDPGTVADELRSDPLWRSNAEPYAPLVRTLETSADVDADMPWLARALTRVLHRTAARRSRYRGAVVHFLEDEMVRQAVRRDSPLITTAHAVIAIASLSNQLAMTGTTLVGGTAELNRGGDILVRNGIRPAQLVEAPIGSHDETESLTPAAANERFWSTSGPPWGRLTTDALDKAVNLAQEHDHVATGTTHLLCTLLTDEHSAASILIRALGGEPTAIRIDAERELPGPLADER